MIKKAIHIVLSSILLISTIGVTVSKHYSGAQLYSVALFGEADSCCEGSCDCCSDEISYYHLEGDYFQSSTIELQNPKVKTSTSEFFIVTSFFTESFKTMSARYICDTSPAYTSNLPAFLQVFRC